MALRIQLAEPGILRWRYIGQRRVLCTNRKSGEFSGESAYEVLGVPENCSSSEMIKASFRKLAKKIHPDLSDSSTSDSTRFLQILAAYEILSDSKKRAYYDSCLTSQRRILQKHPEAGSLWYMNSSSVVITDHTEVVEWLKYYRVVINDILMEQKVAVGSGYFNELESELYSAIRAAYYGPFIESLDLLPECFEAEERSVYETSEVLHLVSGRDLFGIISLADKVPELPKNYHELASIDSMSSGISKYVEQTSIELSSGSSQSANIQERHIKN